MPPLLIALVLAVLLLAAGPAAAPAGANPVVEGDRPDPTVLEFGGRFYAASTTSAWAPLFPILRSDDLVTWREVGAVLERPPAWGNGRFWAPELVRAPGGRGVLAYWSSSAKGGRPCIGVASAPRPEGPWRDRGRAVCPAGGAIDAAPVTDERGRPWLAWKALGVGGGIHLQPLRRDGLRVLGPLDRGAPLIRPDRPWERGVTEGASFVRRDGWWYLFYAGGNCCRPPCTYAEGVARSRTLAGPYEKRPEPLMTGNEHFSCPGHGTLLTVGARTGAATGTSVLLHHAYRREDTAGHRRLMLLSAVRFGQPDGWPVIEGPLPAAASPLGAPPAPPTRDWSEAFAGRRLGPGWQWLWNRPPRAAVRAGRLELRCAARAARPAFVARQVPADRFAAAARLRPDAGATAFLAVHDHAGALRGIARRADGTGYAFAVDARGHRATGAPLAEVPEDVIVSAAPGGLVGLQAGGTAVPPGPAATGPQPTRIAVGCFGGGRAAFPSVRLRAAPDGG
jgi:beta-xylosidase